MTTMQRIQSTPMAPYVGLMEGMSNQDKVAVATFLVAMVPNVRVVEEPVKTNAEIIREKYKNLRRTPRVKKLMQLREDAALSVGCLADTDVMRLGIVGVRIIATRFYLFVIPTEVYKIS